MGEGKGVEGEGMGMGGAEEQGVGWGGKIGEREAGGEGAG